MAHINDAEENWETAESIEIVLKVRRSQIELLYGQTVTSLAGVLVVAISACVALWEVVPQWKLLLWSGASVSLTILRGFLIVAYRRRSSPANSDLHTIFKWARRHVLGVTASAILWALPSIFLWPANSPVHQMIWPICIVPLSAAAVATYCTWVPSYRVFLILTTVPLSIRFFTEGGLVFNILGMLALFFIVVLIQTGRTMHAASLTALIVGYRNEELSTFLSGEKIIQDELNARLQHEIEEKILSQKELKFRNENLDDMNTQLLNTKTSLEITNNELHKSILNIKQLSGMLPICASCKSIRNDKGYWEQIEEYIRDHSEAEFTHGICPTCIPKYYPEFTKKNT